MSAPADYEAADPHHRVPGGQLGRHPPIDAHPGYRGQGRRSSSVAVARPRRGDYHDVWLLELLGTLQLEASDTHEGWHVVIGAGTVQAKRGHDRAGAVVSGPAAGLYLLPWNRQDPRAAGVTVRGDTSALALWHDVVQVRWES